MAIKHKIKFKNEDRDRGTSPAALRSSGPKQRPERVANDMKQPIWINEDEEYCKHLARFFKGEVE